MQEKTFFTAWLPELGLLGVAAVLAAIFRYLGQEPHLKTRVPEFVALSLVAGVLYLVGVWTVHRFPLGAVALLTILSSGVLFRLLVLPATPSLSDDVYRYQWDGRVQRAHFNPYLVYP